MDAAAFAYVADADRPRPPMFSSCTVTSQAVSGALIADARYPRLCARLGLADYWVTSGRWPDFVDQGVTSYDFKAECRKQVGNPL